MDIRTLKFDVGKETNYEGLKNHIEKLLTRNRCYSVQNILIEQPLSPEQQRDAHVFWSQYGRRIREKINDDFRLELILRKVLPTYFGPQITLYRGENIERYRSQRVGFCWTDKQEVARMFARGLNAQPTRGILLKYCFDKEQIIAGPSSHSIYLGEREYTVASSTIDFSRMTIID